MSWPNFAEMILDIRQALGRIEGRLSANTERLDRIEDRINKTKAKFPDLAPYLYGLVILGLAAAGKIDWGAAAGLLSGK